MITILSQNTKERQEEMEQKYSDFKELYYNTTLTVREILKKLEIGYQTEAYDYIKKMNKENGVNPYKRGGLIKVGKWLV